MLFVLFVILKRFLPEVSFLFQGLDMLLLINYYYFFYVSHVLK